MGSRLLLALALVLIHPAPTMAQDRQNATRLAAEIQSTLPGATVVVLDSDGLDITFEGQTRPVGIGSVNASCAQGAASCDAAIHSYALKAASYMLEIAPLKQDQLRIVVRTRSYLENMSAQTHSSDGFVLEPLSGDFVSVCYRDLPRGRRPITPQDLPVLHLNASTALSQCRANSRRALPPLASRWQLLPQQGIGSIRDGDDISGYLAFPEAWRPLAKQLGGLIVAIPSDDTLLYARGTTVLDTDALAKLAEQFRAQASLPISAQVLRWTEHGWVPVVTP